MELKLVYRALRKISDWTVNGYYSEICIEGQENVPKDSPVVVAATHHNEIIDIAVLAVTISHGRHLSFWAKSTMFKNPLMGAILASSGAIPVKRNPNAAVSVSNTSSSDPSRSSSSNEAASSSPTNDRASLFQHTSAALARGEAVGVFPEGTSYTQSEIVQVMPGAGWVGVEYLRWVRPGGPGPSKSEEGEKGKGKGKDLNGNSGLKVVPVAIVYTDKAKYQSRVCVRYGMPIDVDFYAAQLFNQDDDDEHNLDVASKAVVKKIMDQVEKQLKEMTVNAKDWDTICAASMARTLLWGDEDRIPLKDWVGISQRLVEFLEPTENMHESERSTLLELKRSLTTYYALLQHTGIKHSILSSLLPPISPTNSSLSLLKSTLSIIASLPLALINFAFFIPPLILHIPAYLLGSITARLLAPKYEDEAVAQYAGIGGGLGMGVGILSALGILGWQKALGIVEGAAGGWLGGYGKVKSVLGLAGTVYCSVWVLVKWHRALVGVNYRQLQRLLTYHQLVSAFLFSRHFPTNNDGDFERYTHPILPAENPFIRKTKAAAAKARDGSSESITTSASSDDTGNTADGRQSEDQKRTNPPPPSGLVHRELVRALVAARAKAYNGLVGHLSGREDELLGFLADKGAEIRYKYT